MPNIRDRAARVSPLDHDPAAVVWARKAKGVTQTWLAREIGVSPGHMSEIEGGSRNAPPHLLNKIAEALNCPVTVLERKRDGAA
jgi:transcriptional regulator with XRE-family HTH domain